MEIVETTSMAFGGKKYLESKVYLINKPKKYQMNKYNGPGMVLRITSATSEEDFDRHFEVTGVE